MMGEQEVVDDKQTGLDLYTKAPEVFIIYCFVPFLF